MMMGLWFATTFPADILAGYLGGFWSSMAKTNFFLMIAAVAALGGVLIGALEPRAPVDVGAATTVNTRVVWTRDRLKMDTWWTRPLRSFDSLAIATVPARG